MHFDPALEGFSQDDCKNGTLYVIESLLAFVSASGAGFTIQYPTITLHAISRAESGPSIYCQLDESNSPNQGDDEVTDMRELSIVPVSHDSLESIFEALSVCAALHPDPDAEDDMGDDLDEAYTDATESHFETFDGTPEQELSQVGRVRSDFTNNSRFAPY